MSKAKIVIKEKNREDGINFSTKYRGEDGLCVGMAIGFAVDLAKRNNLGLDTIVSLMKDMYNVDEEENENEN
jgi:hypothetical protein